MLADAEPVPADAAASLALEAVSWDLQTLAAQLTSEGHQYYYYYYYYYYK